MKDEWYNRIVVVDETTGEGFTIWDCIADLCCWQTLLVLLCLPLVVLALPAAIVGTLGRFVDGP